MNIFLIMVQVETIDLFVKGNPWFWAIFGVLLYNYLVFNIAKDEVDNTSKSFSYKRYVKTHWDNWIWSFILVPVIVIFGHQLFYYLMQWQGWDWQFYDVFYLSAGVLAEGLYYVLKKFSIVVKALRSKV